MLLTAFDRRPRALWQPDRAATPSYCQGPRQLMESRGAPNLMTAANDLAVRRALEAAGVEFIDENGGGPGVRLRQRRRPKAPKK